ncbi:uncharacterized protein WM277_016525 [Molossus nigricans]
MLSVSYKRTRGPCSWSSEGRARPGAPSTWEPTPTLSGRSLRCPGELGGEVDWALVPESSHMLCGQMGDRDQGRSLQLRGRRETTAEGKPPEKLVQPQLELGSRTCSAVSDTENVVQTNSNQTVFLPGGFRENPERSTVKSGGMTRHTVICAHPGGGAVCDGAQQRKRPVGISKSPNTESRKQSQLRTAGRLLTHAGTELRSAQVPATLHRYHPLCTGATHSAQVPPTLHRCLPLCTGAAHSAQVPPTLHRCRHYRNGPCHWHSSCSHCPFPAAENCAEECPLSHYLSGGWCPSGHPSLVGRR